MKSVMMMKGREGKGAPPSDLLVCFPSRAHLSLMPKPICSPARPSESNHHQHHNRRHHLKKSGGGGGGGGGGLASPLLWAKTKPTGSDMTSSEPTSPKVTCAGQIKVRTTKAAAGSCKNWQSVMEEIEKIHNSNHSRRQRRNRKRSNWIESLGLKKEIVQFMACLRSIRFDFRCFGSPIPESDLTSEDDDDDDDEYDKDEEDEEDFKRTLTGSDQIDVSDEADSSSRTVFSKWFMVLQENQSSSSSTNNSIAKQRYEEGEEEESGSGLKGEESVVAPPSNALLLMRCRSAPAKSWLEEKEEEEERKGKEEEEKKQRKDNVVVMRYEPDFYKLSSEIAKETWVVGGITDPLSRSRSWKR